MLLRLESNPALGLIFLGKSCSTSETGHFMSGASARPLLTLIRLNSWSQIPFLGIELLGSSNLGARPATSVSVPLALGNMEYITQPFAVKSNRPPLKRKIVDISRFVGGDQFGMPAADVFLGRFEVDNRYVSSPSTNDDPAIMQ